MEKIILQNQYNWYQNEKEGKSYFLIPKEQINNLDLEFENKFAVLFFMNFNSQNLESISFKKSFDIKETILKHSNHYDAIDIYTFSSLIEMETYHQKCLKDEMNAYDLSFDFSLN